MKISIPNNFVEERTYIINILIKEFLGLNFELEISQQQDYVIEFTDKKLTIKDSFFSFQQGESYLKIENIPSSVKFTVNPFIVENNIPILYGMDNFEINDDEIVCRIDIFASAFFMLTRWEEYVNKERDLHNRFPAIASLAYKNNFLNRPIVNEYVEMLWNMLKHLKIEQNRKDREFQFILTHDVDRILYWKEVKRTARVFAGDLLKRRSIPLFIRHLSEYLKVKVGIQKDPFDTFDYIMDLSERTNLKSRFYFMSGGITRFDNYYKIDEEASLKIIKKIKDRNHIIGFHPSFNTYNNPEQWKKEKNLLEKVAGIDITEGRQHYLRFEAPLTWNIWDNNNMKNDYTLGYADYEGFRCGTCYEFSVFDFINRKPLILKEYPLIVMEGSLITYQTVTPKEMLSKTVELLEKTKKYKGNFVYLWHNSSFDVEPIKEYKYVYESIVKSQQKF